MRRRLVYSSILAALALGAAVPSGASAAARVGVADNDPRMFSNPFFQALKPKITRKIVPIDTISKGGADLADLDAYMAAAGLSGIEVLVTFNPTRDHFSPGRDGTKKDLPSVSTYTKAFKAFRARYPNQKVFSPWNEINSKSQPTYWNAKRAAQFSNVVAKNCKGCKIVAGDFLDTSNMATYYRKFVKELKFTPKYWGLHNYGDTNRFRTKFTKDFLKLTRKGELWLTETGGFYKFCRHGQEGENCAWPADEGHQVKAMRQMFKLAKSNKRIKRLYVYHFFGEGDAERFDSGIVSADGTSKRKAYDTVAANMRR